MYAIIRDGGHQHKVEPGNSILIERTGLEPGASVTFDHVLYVEGRVGTPTVEGATVDAVVEGPVKGQKLLVTKYKRRKNYRRRQGHRQQLTRVQITAINS